MVKTCDTCIHSNVCKFTEEELCKGTKVRELITDCKDYIPSNIVENVWRPATELPTRDGSYIVVKKYLGNKWLSVLKFTTNLQKIDKYDFRGKNRAGWYDYADGTYYEVDSITHWRPELELPE